MAKYAIDTNVYIDAFNDAVSAEALKTFLRARLPSTFLSAVVVQELRVGARTPMAANTLHTDVFDPFERRGRVFAPSAMAFKECGCILVDLIVHDGLNYAETKRSLVNDVLLATSCREQGITLVTSDEDFDIIRPHLKGLQTVPPWP
jgi:predicted nucleic acid-binding protein